MNATVARPGTGPGAVPLQRGHLVLVHSVDSVPAEALDPRLLQTRRDVPPLVAGTAGLAVLLAGSVVALVLADVAGPARLLIALGGIVSSGVAALVTIGRVAFGGRR